MRELRYIQAQPHGVIRAAGIDKYALWRATRSGLLVRRYRGVYTYGPSTQAAELLAAVFAAGAGAALTSLNAAAFYVHTRFGGVGITVAVPTRRRSQGFKLIVGLDPGDIRIRNEIPVVSFERMLMDAPLQAEQLAHLIHEGAYRRVFSAAATRRAIARTPGRHGKLERAIQMHEAGSAGTRSDLEDRFMTLVRGAKLPEPIVNTHVEGVEVDFRWGDYCVEVDGPGHLRPATRAADEAKQARLEAHGFTVVRFTEAAIDRAPREVLRELAAHKLSRRRARQ
jgi:very-short-patch-repair endonuclease